jgi:O-antigen ligase
VPLALAGHALGLHEAVWIQKTGKARIALWSVTAREAMKSPILGIGAASTKMIDDRMKQESDVGPIGAGKATPESFENRTGRHAHNVYLQTWFELGLVGALMLLAMGLILVARLARLPAETAPYAAALLASGMVMAGLSWGFWQPWFVPVFLIAGLALVLAVRARERDAFAFFAEHHISARSRQAS